MEVDQKGAKIDPRRAVPGRGRFSDDFAKLAVSIAPGLREVEGKVRAYNGIVSDRSETLLTIFYRSCNLRLPGATHREGRFLTDSLYK